MVEFIELAFAARKLNRLSKLCHLNNLLHRRPALVPFRPDGIPCAGKADRRN